MAKEKTDAEVEVKALHVENAKLRKENAELLFQIQTVVSNEMEKWIDNKIRGFAYGPDLKKKVMPMLIGKPFDNVAKRIFYETRDEMVKKLYPDARTGPGTWF
jgi:hypothetical protein